MDNKCTNCRWNTYIQQEQLVTKCINPLSDFYEARTDLTILNYENCEEFHHLIDEENQQNQDTGEGIL